MFTSLVTRARDGDAAAMTELVRQYEPELRIIARVRLGPALRAHLDSVDLVQSVHRSVLAGLKDGRFHFDDPAGLLALAAMMVRRKVARQWRKLKRQQRLSRPACVANSVDLLVSLSTSDSDPAAQASLRERVERLFGRMNEMERRLVELRFAGHTTAEAARILGLEPDVTRVQLHRLRQRLRDAGAVAELV